MTHRRLAGLALAAAALLLETGCGKDVGLSTTRPRTGRPASSVQAGTVVTGDGAQYLYDDAGSLVEIGTPSSSAVSISGFDPPTGGPGQLVTIFGAGFSPDRPANLVTFGASPASVLSSSASQMLTVVPPGAQSGPISVRVGTSSATSSGSFSVVTGVVVSEFSPAMGHAGTYLSIGGLNFSADPTLDSVVVGGGPATVVAADLTWLGVTVGPSATSGKVTVVAPAGTAASATDFFLLPADLWEWDVGFTGRADPGSQEATTVTLAGQVGLVLFDGQAGQAFTLYVTGSTFAGTTQVTVHQPDGTALDSFVVAPGSDQKFVVQTLPRTGTHTIRIEPKPGSAGSLNLKVLPEVVMPIQPGTAGAMVLARGQNGRFTFNGSVGDSLGMAVSALATEPAGGALNLTVVRPDGVYMNVLLGVAGPNSWALPRLPLTGNYLVWVRPAGTAGAALTLLLSSPNVGAMAIDGPPVDFQNQSPGQVSRFLFVGSAGDRLGLGISPLTFVPSGGSLSLILYGPDGAVVWNGSTSSPNSWQLPLLPKSGTYTLEVRPPGTATATAAIFLSRATVGELATDGTAIMFQSTRVGQAGWYTFSAQAGQRFVMQVTAGTNSGSFSVLVYPPTVNTVTSLSVSAGTDNKLSLGALPESGRYTVALTPGLAAVGQVSLRLVQGASDTLAVDDPPKQFSLAVVQNGRYAFTGSVGDRLGFGIPAIATVPVGASIDFTVFRPDGGTLWAGATYYPTAFQLPALPSSGTYVLDVKPRGVVSATFTVLLSRPLSGSMTIDGPTLNFSGSRVGQTGRYTFAGSGGRRLTLQATAGTFTGSLSVNVYRPDGTSHAWTGLASGNDTKLDLGALPASGAYMVTVEPTSTTLGQCTLRLVSGAADTLNIDDPPKLLSLGAAQNGRYSLAGVAGDQLGLGLQAIATIPPSGSVSLALYKPDGASLWSSSAYAPTSWQLPPLPVTGTYTLAVQPPGTSSTALTMLASRPFAATLQPDAAATTVTETRIGQAARLSFSGTQGQPFTLRATAGSYQGYIWLTVSHPSGASIASTYLTSGNDLKLDLGSLPATGTYLATLVPTGATLGQASLRLLNYATGVLTVNGAATRIALDGGQNGRYTFTGAAGALLTLAITGLATTPAGRTVYLNVYKPDGVLLWNAYPSAAASYRLPSLPTAGTYTFTVLPYSTAAATLDLQLTGT